MSSLVDQMSEQAERDVGGPYSPSHTQLHPQSLRP